MRNRWVALASGRSKADVVKRYFNTFVSKHPGYRFIVAKKFRIHDRKTAMTGKQPCINFSGVEFHARRVQIHHEIG